MQIGVSGSHITFEKGRVIKTGTGCHAQAKKMFHLQNLYRFHEIYQPQIYSISEMSYTMEAIHGMSAITYLHRMPLTTCQAMLNKLVVLVQIECESSKVQRVEKDEIVSKITSVLEATRKNMFVDKTLLGNIGNLLMRRLMACPRLDLPVGVCHGDPTLSNVIMVGHQLHLLDAIPVFLESPILDAAKLLQDARHFWTARFYGNSVDMGRMRILMKHLLERIELLRFDTRTLEFFAVLNLARILPYIADNEHLTENVIEEIYSYG